MSVRPLTTWCAVLLAVLGVQTARGQQAVGPDPKAYQATVDRAVSYLESVQAADGSFSKQNGPAITALVASGLMRQGRTPSDPMVAKSLKYLEGFVQPSGGIHAAKSRISNYETCVI